jgi:hypothetical protein
MSGKKRLLKYVVVGLLVLAFTGYFAFATFVFSPFERAYGPDVSTLIPRGVDFYFAKADLSDDFERFPDRLAFTDELAATQGGADLLASDLWREQRAKLGLETLEAEIARNLAGLPMEVDLLDALLGRDVALAGYFRGQRIADADWAVYARVNWMGKLAVAGLDNAGLVGLEEQGLTVEDLGGVWSVSSPQLVRKLFVTRLRDVLVISASQALATAALELPEAGSEDSFGLSARYDDKIDIDERSPDKDELEFFVDMRALESELRVPLRWPDPTNDLYGWRLASRLFQASALNELAGIVGFGGGFSIDARGEFSTEEVAAHQRRIYRGRNLDRRDLANELARFAPADSGLFVGWRASGSEFLEQAFAALERSVQQLLDDAAREVWGHPDHVLLLDEIDDALGDRFALIVRPNDYPADTEIPSSPDLVPAWALVARVADTEKIASLRAKVISNQVQLGIQGPAGSTGGGVFTNEVAGGHRVYEYWSAAGVPGTGHIASVTAGDWFILSNSHQMLGHLLKTYYDGESAGPRFRRLPDHVPFQIRLNDALDALSVAAWINPRAMRAHFEGLIPQLAEDQVRGAIDWTLERRRVEEKVAKESYPGQNPWQFPPAEREVFTQLVERQLEEYEEEVLSQHVPARRAEMLSQLSWACLSDGILAAVAFTQKDLRLAVRASIPLDPAPAP